jgi:hypothetical protein
MQENYNHTQIGYLIIYIFGTMIILIMTLQALDGYNFVASIVFVLMVLSLFLFYKLNVSINEKTISIKFGLGLIKKTFRIQDIKSCQITKTPWYWGWGIRLIPKGYLYNVSGFYSVELAMKNGSVNRIGTDEPEELLKSIQESLTK